MKWLVGAMAVGLLMVVSMDETKISNQQEGHMAIMSSTPDVLSVEQMAPVIWEAIRQYQAAIGDPVNPPWDGDVPEAQRQSFIDGAIRGALDGRSAEEQHRNWVDNRTADGWTYGDVKDPDAKTHPNLVPYHDLPAAQRRKDLISLRLVEALTVSV